LAVDQRVLKRYRETKIQTQTAVPVDLDAPPLVGDFGRSKVDRGDLRSSALRGVQLWRLSEVALRRGLEQVAVGGCWGVVEHGRTLGTECAMSPVDCVIDDSSVWTSSGMTDNNQSQREV